VYIRRLFFENFELERSANHRLCRIYKSTEAYKRSLELTTKRWVRMSGNVLYIPRERRQFGRRAVEVLEIVGHVRHNRTASEGEGRSECLQAQNRRPQAQQRPFFQEFSGKIGNLRPRGMSPKGWGCLRRNHRIALGKGKGCKPYAHSPLVQSCVLACSFCWEFNTAAVEQRRINEIDCRILLKVC
jgi:hypothetical protein